MILFTPILAYRQVEVMRLLWRETAGPNEQPMARITITLRWNLENQLTPCKYVVTIFQRRRHLGGGIVNASK